MKNMHYALLVGFLGLVATSAFSQATPDQLAQDKRQLHQYKKEVDFYQKKVNEAVKQGDMKSAEQWEQLRQQAKNVYNAQKQRVKQEQPLQVNTRPPEDNTRSPEDPRIHVLNNGGVKVLPYSNGVIPTPIAPKYTSLDYIKERKRQSSNPNSSGSTPPIGDGWIQYFPGFSLEPELRDHYFVMNPAPPVYDDGEGIIHYDKVGTVDTFKLLTPNSNRAEIKVRGDGPVKSDYASGMRQFAGSVWLDAPTDNECLMQIFGGSTHATASMFRGGFNVNGGEIRHYANSHQVLASGVYGKWTRFNVIHDVANGTVTAYINGVLAGQWPDDGNARGKNHSFKYGLYGSHDAAHPASVKWKDVSVYYKGALD